MTWQWVIVIGLVLWFVATLFFIAAWSLARKSIPDMDDDDSVCCSRDASGHWVCSRSSSRGIDISRSTEYKKVMGDSVTWDDKGDGPTYKTWNR